MTRSTSSRRRPGRTRSRRDRGAATVELATLAMVILALAFTAIQVGFYYHARKVAQSAARQGVEAGRQIDADDGAGVDQAQRFLDRYGNSLRSAQVSSDGSTPQEIRITVTGTVATLVPGLNLHVTQHAEVPIERWTAP